MPICKRWYYNEFNYMYRTFNILRKMTDVAQLTYYERYILRFMEGYIETKKEKYIKKLREKDN